MIKASSVLAIALFASPAFAHPSCLAAPQPPISARGEPSVAYTIHLIPRAKVHAICGPHGTRDVTACANPDDWQKPAGHWSVVISNDLPRAELACVVRYEKSHLPPNYWGDPGIEDADTIMWLTAQH